MIEGSLPPTKPSAAEWSDALLMSGSEALIGAVRNYIGPIKTPYDKRDLVAKLEAFLRRAETRDSLLALLDSLDVKILGSSILLGPVPEQTLKELFVGELPLFELGVRLANLLDRLLLFRYQAGGRRLIAVNPLLEKEIILKTLDPDLLFGLGGKRQGDMPSADTSQSFGAVTDAKTAIALFAFLFHSPSSARKGGGLTKRAAERARVLFPDLAAAGDRPDLLARALSAAGALPAGEDEDRSPDHEAFQRLLVEWEDSLPYYLAACLAIEGGRGSGSVPLQGPDGDRSGSGGGGATRHLALVLAGALESLPGDFVMGRQALARWLRIAARRARYASDPALALEALEGLGILAARGEGLSLALPRGADAAAAKSGGVLVVEGAHALHLMPEAGIEDRLFVGCVARPVSIGTVWSFEVERDTVRRAFAAGFSAAEMKERFQALAGSGLPQSFSFSLSAWEEEYRALRLYRGFALVADERLRPVIERSAALGRIVAERLAPGVYFLSASTAEEAAAALSAAGLEAPPLVEPTGAARPRSGVAPVGSARVSLEVPGGPAPAGVGGSARSGIAELRGLVGFGEGGASRAGPGPDPEPRLAELRACLASSPRPEEERRELADRIERRLVLTERQIAQSEMRAERLEAGGLDYLGKVRVVERALRASGDRLEVLYRLPGAEPVRALLRPVRLDKNEKGLVLEAEDLATGGPARVPLGAVSTVRRLRASLFGEDK
jgi:hypothetical protein